MADREILFLVEEVPNGGYSARALAADISTDADNLSTLHERVRDAVHCHFDPGSCPSVIRLRCVREEVISA